MKVSTVFAIAAAASFSFGFLTTLHSAERFDNRIRSDFFRGLQGDPAALQRGLEACEKILALNPKAAEALVWHGSGTFFLAGQAFRDGDPGKGAALGGKGLREMEEAVALEPDNLAVRIPRGATLLFASRAMRPERARPLREKSRGDYELALARQKDIFDRLGVHPRGELLSGLAELYLRTDQPEKAATVLKRIVSDLPGTPYARRAQEWSATGDPKIAQCIGCHVE